MSHSQRLAERIKLARQLGCRIEDLPALESLDVRNLQMLRKDIAQSRFERFSPRFKRAAKASALLPNSTLAHIAEHIAGPALSAQIVGLLNPSTALDISLRCSDQFLAQSAIELDPTQASELIRKFPVERAVAVARLLIAQGDFISLGRLANDVDHHLIGEVIAHIEDDEALLSCAFFVESREVLNDLITLLPAERIRAIVRVAGNGEKGRWAEALALTEAMSDYWKGQLGDMVADEGETLLINMLTHAHELDLWDSVLPVVACMSEPQRKTLIKLEALSDPAMLRAIMLSADECNLWPLFLPLVSEMPADTRSTAIHLIEELPDDVLIRIFEAALTHHLWPHLIGLVTEAKQEHLQHIAGLLARQGDDFLFAMLQDIQTEDLWPMVLPLFTLNDALRSAAAELITRLNVDSISSLIDGLQHRPEVSQILGLLKPALGKLDKSIQNKLQKFLDGL